MTLRSFLWTTIILSLFCAWCERQRRLDAQQFRAEVQQLLDRPLGGVRVTLEEFCAEADDEKEKERREDILQNAPFLYR